MGGFGCIKVDINSADLLVVFSFLRGKMTSQIGFDLLPMKNEHLVFFTSLKIGMQRVHVAIALRAHRFFHEMTCMHN